VKVAAVSSKGEKSGRVPRERQVRPPQLKGIRRTI